MPEELIAEPIEAAEVETPSEEAIEPVEGEESEGEQQENAVAEEVNGDGRVVPAKYRELFKQDKELKSLFFENREFKNAFPGGVNEAKEILSFFAERGGKDGITELATQLQASQAIDQALLSGNTRDVLDHVKNFAPDAIAKLAPDVLQEFASSNPEECNQMLCGVVANSLSQSGIPQQLYEASLALKYGQTDEAVRLIGEISKGLNLFSERASAPVTPKSLQPQKDASKDELASLKDGIFNEKVTTQIQGFFEPAVAQQAKDAGYANLNARQTAMLNKIVAEEADKAVGDDTLKLIAAARGKKDIEGVMRLVKSRYAQVLPEIVKRESRELFGSPIGKAAPKAPVVAVKTPVTKPASNSRGVDPFAARFQQAIG